MSNALCCRAAHPTLQDCVIVGIVPKFGQALDTQASTKAYFQKMKKKDEATYPFPIAVPDEFVCTPMDSGLDPLDLPSDDPRRKTVFRAYKEFLVRRFAEKQACCSTAFFFPPLFFFLRWAGWALRMPAALCARRSLGLACANHVAIFFVHAHARAADIAVPLLPPPAPLPHLPQLAQLSKAQSVAFPVSLLCCDWS